MLWTIISLLVGVAAVVLIWGLARGYPWFVIQGGLVNGPGLVLSLVGIYYGVSTPLSGGDAVWWAAALVGAIFALVCGFNTLNYVNGSEAAEFRKKVQSAFVSRSDSEE